MAYTDCEMDYKSSGVNIDQGNNAVELIKPLVQKTHSKNVLSNIGGFASGFQLPVQNYNEPILVSATDGIGTKLMLAIEQNSLNTIGIDCVAMCVNDLICMGAEPLFFLDYIACNSIEPVKIKEIINGIVEGCLESSCSLIGGEMAEMNTIYKPNDFDVAGFCVGVVEKSLIIDGAAIAPGDFVYALASSGCHSNGYSLIRQIINNTSILDHLDYNTLLTPTKIYVNTINRLKASYEIKGIANITGGGIQENLVRVLPDGCQALIEKQKINVPEIFKKLQQYGNVSDDEMYRVFNMGVGMIIVSSSEIKEEGCYKIGSISAGDTCVTYV